MTGFDGHIHRRTQIALLVAWFAGLVGGAIAVQASYGFGAFVAGGGALLSLWYTPTAEVVAIQWREHERITEARER